MTNYWKGPPLVRKKPFELWNALAGSRIMKLFFLLEFFVRIENFSLIWRHHHCRWRVQIWPMLGTFVHWAVRVPKLATLTVTWGIRHLRGPVTLSPYAERLAVEPPPPCKFLFEDVVEIMRIFYTILKFELRLFYDCNSFRSLLEKTCQGKVYSGSVNFQRASVFFFPHFHIEKM